MCNYCDSHYTKNGTWFNEDHKELLKEDFDFNLGTYANTLTATVDIYGVDEDENDPKLVLTLDADYADESVIEKVIRIHYCPMCGRNLDQGEAE